MRFFGLISILVVISIGIWLVSGQLSYAPSNNNSVQETLYLDVLDAAKAVSGTPHTTEEVEVYNGVFIAKSATVLDVSGMALEGSLKAEVRQLQKLEVLDMSNNSLTGVPAEIGQLSQLQILNLANNPITGLPHELENLQQLEVLDLKDTQYSETDLAIISERLPTTTQILVN